MVNESGLKLGVVHTLPLLALEVNRLVGLAVADNCRKTSREDSVRAESRCTENKDCDANSIVVGLENHFSPHK